MGEVSCKLLTADDWQAIRDVWADINLSPYARFDKPHSIVDEEVKERLSKWEKYQSKNAFFFGIQYDKKVVGYITFVFHDGYWEVGYGLHSDYQGKGVAKEAMRRTLGFMSLFNKKIVARTALENLPSVSLLFATGFEKVGEEQVSFYNDENGSPIFFTGGIYEYHKENK